jgi:hypothetical protein
MNEGTLTWRPENVDVQHSQSERMGLLSVYIWAGSDGKLPPAQLELARRAVAQALEALWPSE